MIKVMIVTPCLFLIFNMFLWSNEVDSTNAASQQLVANSYLLQLPEQYNTSYVLGFYDGGHKTAVNNYRTGLGLGIFLHLPGVAIATLITSKTRPESIPPGINQIDYTKGYEDSSGAVNRYAAFNGATTGSMVPLGIIAVICIGSLFLN